MYSNNVGSSLKTPASWPFILLIFFIAMALEFTPWPVEVQSYKPIFPMLALVYWALHRPQLVGFSVAIILGIIIDLSNQSNFGVNITACAVIVYLTNILYSRFLLLDSFSGALNVLFILGVGQAVVYFLISLDSGGKLPVLNWRLFWPSISASLTWLALPILIRQLQSLFDVRGRSSH